MAFVQMDSATATLAIMAQPVPSLFLAQAAAEIMGHAVMVLVTVIPATEATIAQLCWNAPTIAVDMDAACLDNASAIQVMEVKTVPLHLSARFRLVMMAQQDNAAVMENVLTESAFVTLALPVTTVRHV